MSSVQERLKMKRAQIDNWSTQEKLCLASAVLRSGDQNWMSVSRSLKAFGDSDRPNDWFSQKSCAVQYSNLLENVEMPKRKKRTDRGESGVETPSENIARKLVEERIEELRAGMQENQLFYAKIQCDILRVKTGSADNKLEDMVLGFEEKKWQKLKEAEAHEQWLKEREEKKLELERAWKPAVILASPNKRKHMRRNSNPSEASSEVECTLDSPLSEPLNVDVISEDVANNVHEVPIEPKPSQTPTSPLLTSLLKSPSPAPVSQGSSILHSAITSLRGASPTITSLLSSAPCVPGTTTPHASGAPPTTVSSSLKNLVSSAIGVEQHHQPLLHNHSPAAGAPTLSMLLELPPSLPGKPLPELPSVAKATVTTTVSPSTVSTVISAVPSHTSTTEKSIAVRTIPTSATTVVPVKKYKSTLQGEDIPLLAQDFQIASSANTDEDVELLPVDSSQNSVVTQQLKSNKEELIEEVLIEEVVVNEDSLITSEIISAPLADVVVASDNEVIKLKEKERDEMNKYFEMSQASEIYPADKKESKTGSALVTTNPTIVMVDPLSSIAKDSKEQCVETVLETSSQGLPEIVNEEEEEEEEEEAELEVVPESEVELSTETVAEVIEISGDQVESMQTEVVTDCEPCIQELENMEVIILDKVQELEEVEIVEEIKELGCEVVEVVMTDQEKVDDLKEEAEESNQDTIQTEDTGCDDSCTVIPETSDIVKEEQNYFEGETISNEEVVENVEQVIDETSFENSIDIQEEENVHIDSVSEKKRDSEKDNDITIDDSEKDESKDKYTKVPAEKCLEAVNVTLSWHPTIPDKTVPSDTSFNNNLHVNVEIKTNEDDPRINFRTTTKEDISQPIISSEESQSHKSMAKKGLEVVEKELSLAVEVSEVGVNIETESEVYSEEVISGVTVPLNYGKENVLEVSKKPISKEDTTEKDVSKSLVKPIPEPMKEADEKKGSNFDVDEKKLLYKEKKDASEPVHRLSSKDESSLCKTIPEKECLPTTESKKVVEEYFSEEERVSNKCTPRKDVHIHEFSSKDLSKDSPKEVRQDIFVAESISKERENGDRKLHSIDEVAKKDSAPCVKDLPGLKEAVPAPESTRHTVKHDFCRRDYKDESIRKEGAKRSYSKDDKRDYGKKRTHAKEVAKQQKKIPVHSKDSESSVHIIKPFTLNEREYKEKEGEKAENFNADLRVKVEYDVHEMERPESSKIKSISNIDKTLLNTLPKESRDPSKEIDVKLEYVEHLDEKLERPIIFRSDTPSTEDDKTSDVEAPKSLGRRRLAAVSALDSIPSSPASTTDEEREYKSWKKSIMLLYGRLATHKYASLFLRPITDDQAPGYSSVVYRPIDLLTIKKNIEIGVVRTTVEFQRDVMLMFLNSIMYNKSSHFVHKMALQMQSEGMQHIQDYLTTQMLVQVAGDSVPIRRETRTMEANKQREMLTGNLEESEGSKRKRNVVPDSDKTTKKKKVDD